MTIPTSRSREEAVIRVDDGRCTGCDHCMAICPSEAITIHGRELSPADVFVRPSLEQAATYERLLALLQRRRSIREFEDRPVERVMIDRILAAAKTAPHGGASFRCPRTGV